MPAARGQGQWALGYREPLNANEQSKKDSSPLTVKQRILDIYSQRGFDSIDGGDLRGRFRWYGLYTQRAEGIAGGKTAILEPEELEAPFFMLRIRIDGGRLTSEQLRTIGEISTEFGRDVADVTDRQNIQLHWIRIEDMPAIWDRLDAVGLSTTEACGDCPRVILGCPLAGVAADEVLDASAALRDVAARYIGDPAFANLPRKFKTSISGCVQHCTNHEINDIAFVGVVHPTLGPGYDLWVGGGLSTNPKLGVRLGAFVAPDEVAEVWAGVTGIFRDYGYRRSRMHARLKFLMADWGPEVFRAKLESAEYLGRALPDGPEAPPTDDRDHIGVHAQSDGNVYIGTVARAGRTSGKQLQSVAALASSYGSGLISTTAQQGLVLLGVSPAAAEEVVATLEAEDLRARPSRFRRGTLACTGLEFCKLAIVETKARSVDLYTELEKRLPDFDEPITINVNGCPNSCARFQTGDIGLKGSIVDGVEGFQIHLGGSLGTDSGFGRKSRGLKVTADNTVDYVEKLLRTYLEHRAPGERFASWARRADEELLR
ncbi:MAG: nitrite and sulphite reductase 4Fe-4S region [Frankiales bacterium]|nr:nitrite and sulphite reductase 4Fe-4S region [Frankiales bacterium]